MAVPNTDGFSTAQNGVVTVMNTSGGQAAFLIAYHLHTNNRHHWFAAQCVQLKNGLMHDLFHPFATLHWIQVWSVPGHRAYRLSYRELTLALVRFASICFPFEIPSTGLMEICALSNQPLPIVSVVFDLFSTLVFVFFGSEVTVFPKMAQVGIGIVVPVDGFCVMFAPEFFQQIREETFKVFSGRNFFRCCDLARPMG